MARNLKRQHFKFYFPKKILWNPFAYLDKKAIKIPKRVILSTLLFIMIIALLKIEDKNAEKNILGIQTQLRSDQKIAFDWEQVLAERPDYRDGWIQLSAIYLKLGEKQKALEAILKAKSLDPHNQTILSLEEAIGNY